MGNPGAQHEFTCTLVHKYPKLMLRIAEIAKVRFPEHELVVAGPSTHQLPDRPPLENDGTVRFLREGKPVYFAQVEVQNRYDLDKFATLRAYYGSEVSKAHAGGHMIVVSPKAGEAAKFRRSEKDRGEEYAYRGSYLSRADLNPMAEKDQSFEERCFAIGLTDFTQGVPEETGAMLREMTDRDATLANLFFRAILEGVPDVAMIESVVQPDMLERLRGLKAFDDYEARVIAEAKASAEANAEVRVEEAEARVEEAEARVEEAEVRGKLASKADALTEFLIMRGDEITDHMFAQIRECEDLAKLGFWLKRAYAGKTAAEIFPED